MARNPYPLLDPRDMEFAKKLKFNGDLDSETKAEFEEQQRRAERKAVDWKYGTINYPKLFLRFAQVIVGVLAISHLIAYLDKKPAPVVNPGTWDYDRDVNKVSLRDLGGGNNESYFIGSPRSKKRKEEITVRIRPIAHGQYPGEYTIEYTSTKPNGSTEDILDQIDQEDIIDYMDGNID